MKNTGFTLVEILIVVIILGILAAIVIPQFTQASNDARESALVSDLQTVRSQLELYKVQHLEAYPAQANFVTQLTSRTDAAGTVGTDATAYPYGPYLQKFPSNPFITTVANQTTVSFAATDPAAGGQASGWFFNTSTGKFIANDDRSTSGGVAHIAL